MECLQKSMAKCYIIKNIRKRKEINVNKMSVDNLEESPLKQYIIDMAKTILTKGIDDNINEKEN